MRTKMTIWIYNTVYSCYRRETWFSAIARLNPGLEYTVRSSVVKIKDHLILMCIQRLITSHVNLNFSSHNGIMLKTAQACGRAFINEVLDRAKIEAGKLELEAIPFDLRSILDNVLSLFSEKSRHKGIEVARIR